ncbi:MAG: prolipoprotein diacylglyceryl transferase [Lachnospiraceae bacterium]|nr:prolipoprotein diacylglyceryl transferase [Lachnospiraceae bacterium]MBQ8330100.1 prolipoprotein diacylglyceryl transferase [Lachnospiraceae bacterium]
MADMMGEMDIAFPNLGIYLTNVPKTIMIGNFGIALYGIVIGLGMILGLTLSANVAKKTGHDPDVIWDLAAPLLIFGIMGARIYYVIFMWDFYKDDPIQILNLRGGGLAIYGGIIAGLLTIYIFCKVRKQKFPLILDFVMYGLLVGQIMGRWGNFFNREVFGEYTNNLLAMRIPVSMVRERDISASIAAHMAEGTNYIQVHPTFLYEGMWNLAILVFLLLYLEHKKFDGEIALLYFAGYGIGRALIESIRTDQLYITGTHIPVSMVLGLAMAAAAICAELVIRYRIANREKAGADSAK